MSRAADIIQDVAIAYSGGHAVDFEAAANEVLEELTVLRADVARIKLAGRLMSNWMYNMAQRSGEVLDVHHCRSLDTMREEWDAATQEPS